jgi:hypothetical protein
MPTDEQRETTINQACVQTATPWITLSTQRALQEVDRLANAGEFDQTQVRDQDRVTSDFVRDLISSLNSDHARDAALVRAR